MSIRIKDLWCRYPDDQEWILRGIELDIGDGEFLGVVGPSGSGKSTLAYCIAGLMSKVFDGEMRGAVVIGGRDVLNQSPREASEIVGTVFQNPETQIVSHRVRDEILLGLELDGLNDMEIDDIVDRHLRSVGLAGFDMRSPSELSIGEKQRVAIASALARGAGVVVLDEALSMQDPASRKQIVRILEQLHAEGRTIIFISHSLEDVIHLLDRVCLISNGKIARIGASKDVLYSDKYLEILEPPPIVRRALGIGDPSRVLTPSEFLSEIGKIAISGCDDYGSVQDKNTIALDGVSYEYSNGCLALQDVTLSISQGESVGIVGPNGSGKSTLALVAGGLLEPQHGAVYLGDTPIQRMARTDIVSEIGIVFQNPSLSLFCESVSEEIEFGLNRLHVAEPEVVAFEEMRALGLENLSTKDPLRLSFGQQKMVAIMGTSVMRPSVIFVDEPELGIDSRILSRILKYLEELRSSGCALVFISHDLNLIYEHTSRVVVVSDGRIIADGSRRSLLRDQELLRSIGLDVPSLALIDE